MSCEHCAELAEEVAWLRSELGLQEEASEVHRLELSLDLPRQLARLVLRLYRINGRVLPRAQADEMFGTLAGHEEYISNITSVHISRLRKRIGFDSITSVYGNGYCLTKRGREIVRDALLIREAA